MGGVLMLVLALRRMLEEKHIDVCDQHGHTVLAVNSNINFLTMPGVKAEIGLHLRDTRVNAINLLGCRFIDSTGALMLAEVMRQHPQLRVWIAEESIAGKLQHAGVDASRIALMGNRQVNLPDVFRQIQRVAG